MIEFDTKPMCGEEKGDCIFFLIIFNLILESIIRKAEEANGYKICENTE